MAELKINLNFAPCVDLEINQESIIKKKQRSYGVNPQNVSKYAQIFVKEHNRKKIATSIKHFPGHGDSTGDSHKILPSINLHITDLIENHIRPFEEAIKANIPAIMVAHVVYPALEDEILPASVSKQIIQDLLIDNLGFNGLIITDDMEMNGIKGLSRLEACIKAINAGVNMFIYRDTTKDIYNQ